MALADEFDILHDRIKANQTQYDLHREAAESFNLSYKELNKYEDLGNKPGEVGQSKLEYSALGKIFNKGL